MPKPGRGATGQRTESDVRDVSEFFVCAWVIYKAIEERGKEEVRRGIRLDPVQNRSSLDIGNH